MQKDRVLIIEYEKPVRAVLRDFLEEKGYDVSTAETGTQAEHLCSAAHPDVVIVDCELSDGHAELVSRFKAIDATIPIIALTGYGSIDVAANAVRMGAEQFLTKSTELATLHVVIQRSLENRRNQRKQLAEKARMQRTAIDPFLGRSDKIKNLAEQARRAALNDFPVLIEGETGTGKGMLARWLHEHGSRAAEPFLDLNCRGFSRHELEVELFGEQLGPLPEDQSKIGILEIAHKGTVFLDEIVEIDLQTQAKIMRVLEDKQFRRLGEFHDRRTDIRLLGATQQNLARLARERRFRSKLTMRIGVSNLYLPPLRERLEDIPILSAAIVENFAADLGADGFELSEGALRILQSYSWPGNVRELRNVLERAVLVSTGSVVTDLDLRFDMRVEQDVDDNGHCRTLEEIERRYIELVLRRERGRVGSAARKLGIPRSSLYHKIKQYRTQQPGFGLPGAS
jgi:DNA-binding NtrC family response regulator